MPTPQELDEIWDDLRSFKSSRMWGILLNYMQNLYAEAAEAALQASDMKDVIMAKGIAHAVKAITNFEDNIPTLSKLKSEKMKDEII